MKWVFLLGLCLSACVEARYRDPSGDGGDACAEDACPTSLREDGGALSAEDAGMATVDASAQDTGGPEPDPAAALLGKYAVHARFYGRERSSGLVEVLHELFVIADIAREAGALKMRVRTCEDSGHLLAAGLRTDVRVKFPEPYPIRTYDLVVDGKNFHTIGAPLAIGYTERWPDGCTAGARLPSSNGWTGGSCLCVEGDAPPTRAEDCRVIDADLDGAPGISVESSGLVNATQAVRIRDSSQYVLGVIDEGTKRHRANFQKDEDFLELGCTGGGNCMMYQGRFCAIATQLVSFVPLDDGDVSCAELLRRVDSNELFSGEGLDGSFPAGC